MRLNYIENHGINFGEVKDTILLLQRIDKVSNQRVTQSNLHPIQIIIDN